MREEKYDISGMHCAACSASVERVTRKLPGVARSEVNLTTGIMTIAYDESQCTQEQIVAKVEKAGFGRRPGTWSTRAPATVQNAEDAETAALKRRKIELIAAAVFSAVLLYVSMGQMLPFGLPALPLPDLFSMHTHPMNFAVLQLILGRAGAVLRPELLPRGLQVPLPRQPQHGLPGGHRLRLLLCVQPGDDLSDLRRSQLRPQSLL